MALGYLNIWSPRNPVDNSYGQPVPPQAKILSMPTLFAALRHKDETVRRTARERLRLINEKDAKQITTRMAKEEEEKEVNSGSGGGGLGGGGGGGFF